MVLDPRSRRDIFCHFDLCHSEPQGPLPGLMGTLPSPILTVQALVQKCRLFVNFHKVENVNRGGYVVKKRQNHVNVVCERPHMQMNSSPIKKLFDYIIFL
jgi:hypothetical protein